MKKKNQKINELNISLDKNGELINKINNENISIKLKYKNLEQEMNKLLIAKKNDNVNYQKNMDKIKYEYESKIKELNNKINIIEKEINNKKEEMIINKFNSEKIISLNEQKIIFLDQEINSLKEKNNVLIKQSKLKEDSLNKEIIKLNEKINLLNKENKNENDMNNNINMNLANLMNYFKENIKLQNEENKNLFEKIFTKEKKDNNDKEIYKNYQELIHKNTQLKIDINKQDTQIKKLENEIINLKEYKEIFKHISGLRCKYCNGIYNYENIKNHYNECQKKNSKENIMNNNSNIKIKILKGNIKQDELGKNYLEYILDINYTSQNWRINKKFIQFANLYKTLNNIFKQDNIEMPLSCKIFSSVEKYQKGFHKNKIKQLELFLKDLAENDIFNKCKIFQKFIELDKNVDEENIN